jgi:hypothetical protein
MLQVLPTRTDGLYKCVRRVAPQAEWRLFENDVGAILASYRNAAPWCWRTIIRRRRSSAIPFGRMTLQIRDGPT